MTCFPGTAIALRIVSVALLVAVLLLLAIGVPYYLVHGAEPLAAMPDSSAADLTSLAAFQDGYHAERGGDLETALTRYRVAERSAVPEIHRAARGAVERVNKKLTTLPTPLLRGLRTLSDWALTLGSAALLLGLLVLLMSVGRLRRRSGTQIGPFFVFPESAGESSARFVRLLNEEIALAARAFGAEQLRRIGAEVTLSKTKLEAGLENLAERATAALRQGDPKSWPWIAAAELFSAWHRIDSCPEYVLTGSVVIHPGHARASAQLLQAARPAAELVASSAEVIGLEQPRTSALVRAETSGGLAIIAADPREDAARLADLAGVLAAKFVAAWIEMEVQKQTRPARGFVPWLSRRRMAKEQQKQARSSRRRLELLPFRWQSIRDHVCAVR